MVFSGGPYTEGPGLVVGNELREPIQLNHNIEWDTVKHFKCATKVSGMPARTYCYSDSLHCVFLYSSLKELLGVLLITHTQSTFSRVV